MELDLLLIQIVFSDLMQGNCFVDVLRKVREMSLFRDLPDDEMAALFEQAKDRLSAGNGDEADFSNVVIEPLFADQEYLRTDGCG